MSLSPIRQHCSVAKHYTHIRSLQKVYSTKQYCLLGHWRSIKTGQLQYIERSASDLLSQGKDSNKVKLSQGKDSNKVNHTNNTVSFTPVYRFKYIVHLKVLARLKIYQTAMTVVAVPPAFYLHSINSMSTELLAASLGIASLACTMLFVISFTIRKVVGMLSLSIDGKLVKISHLTFWGKRNDIICDVSDIVPLADMSENPTDIFVRLNRYSTKNELHFFLRHGQITDVSMLEDIIGSVK